VEPARTARAGGVAASPARESIDASRAVDTARRRPSPTGTGMAVIVRLTDRPFGWIFRLWIWLVLVCAALFWTGGWLPGGALREQGTAIRPDSAGAWTSLYFSLVTATSVGYGDVVPIGAARSLAVAESVAALLIFGCLISKIVSRRQEELVEETHRITFETRLGRVRTNLHLVLTDLQGIERLCAEDGQVASRLRARLESAASVFTGELHVVHDLLFRPEQVPDEEVLAGILVTVAAGLGAFRDLLECLPGGPTGSGLRGSLATMNRLAQEICSDCVPRAYAPDLRRWMDEIRDSGRALEALTAGMP
jgi:hypothetical protein